MDNPSPRAMLFFVIDQPSLNIGWRQLFETAFAECRLEIQIDRRLVRPSRARSPSISVRRELVRQKRLDGRRARGQYLTVHCAAIQPLERFDSFGLRRGECGLRPAFAIEPSTEIDSHFPATVHSLTNRSFTTSTSFCHVFAFLVLPSVASDGRRAFLPCTREIDTELNNGLCWSP